MFSGYINGIRVASEKNMGAGVFMLIVAIFMCLQAAATCYFLVTVEEYFFTSFRCVTNAFDLQKVTFCLFWLLMKKILLCVILYFLSFTALLTAFLPPLKNIRIR